VNGGHGRQEGQKEGDVAEEGGWAHSEGAYSHTVIPATFVHARGMVESITTVGR